MELVRPVNNPLKTTMQECFDWLIGGSTKLSAWKYCPHRRNYHESEIHELRY